MTIEQFHTYQEQTFDSFIITLIKNETKDALKELARRTEREISMSQLLTSELARIAVTDNYNVGQMTFTAGDETFTIKDAFLGMAIASLPPKLREILLLSYFVGKNDPQIAALLNLTPRTIRYRKRKTLQKLKEMMEALENEG